MAAAQDLIYGIFEKEVNRSFLSRLRSAGAELFVLPDMPVVPVRSISPAQVASFDWIIFENLNSIEPFLSSLSDPFILDDLRICACGEAIADQLRFSQVHADVIPADRDPQTIFDAIAAYETPEGLRFLIPTEQGTKPSITSLLQNAGAHTENNEVFSYQMPGDFVRLKSIILGGAFDEFIFVTPSDVYDLASLCDLSQLEFVPSAANENTFRTLVEFGLRPKMHS